MNRHERRKSDAVARARSRALLRLASGEERTALFEFVAKTDAAAVQLTLLRLSYRGFKTGRLTAVQARLFGARV